MMVLLTHSGTFLKIRNTKKSCCHPYSYVMVLTIHMYFVFGMQIKTLRYIHYQTLMSVAPLLKIKVKITSPWHILINLPYIICPFRFNIDSTMHWWIFSMYNIYRTPNWTQIVTLNTGTIQGSYWTQISVRHFLCVVNEISNIPSSLVIIYKYTPFYISCII